MIVVAFFLCVFLTLANSLYTYTMPLRLVNAPVSTFSCKGPTCVFRNVCVRSAQANSWEGAQLSTGRPVIDFPVIETTARPSFFFWSPALAPYNLVTGMFPVEWGPLYVPAAVSHVQEDHGAVFAPGVTVLGAYYGAENFGHHIVNNWNRFHMLRTVGLGTAASDRDAGEAQRHITTRLLLARNCYSYAYGLLFSPHDCLRHQSRFLPLSGFDELVNVSEKRACFEFLVAGDAWLFVQPAEDMWSLRNLIYGQLGLRPDAQPRGDGILILVKTTEGTRLKSVHATWESSEKLASHLRLSTGMEVQVRAAPGPDTSLIDQINVMSQFSHVVLPGGGAGFIAMLAAHGTHVLVAAYVDNPFDKLWLTANKCFSRVSFITLTNRSFDVHRVSREIRRPAPRVSQCDLEGRRVSLQTDIRLTPQH